MKKIILYLGVILCIFGAFPFFKYALDFQVLSTYGKGYVIGKIILILVGVVLILLARGFFKRK